jgi:hypothetical protein
MCELALKGVYQSVFGIFVAKSGKNVPMPDQHIWHSDYAVGWVTKLEFSSWQEQESLLCSEAPKPVIGILQPTQ